MVGLTGLLVKGILKSVLIVGGTAVVIGGGLILYDKATGVKYNHPLRDKDGFDFFRDYPDGVSIHYSVDETVAAMPGVKVVQEGLNVSIKNDSETGGLLEYRMVDSDYDSKIESVNVRTRKDKSLLGVTIERGSFGGVNCDFKRISGEDALKHYNRAQELFLLYARSEEVTKALENFKGKK